LRATLITRGMQMAGFLREQRKIVCKPLDGMGGRRSSCSARASQRTGGVRDPHRLRTALRDRASATFPTSWNRATRRVLLIEGEPVPYALAPHTLGAGIIAANWPQVPAASAGR